jgi:sec-independent protein translocase protein TatC
MSIFSHLDELRRRLLYCVLCLTATASLCFTFSQQLFTYLRQPLADITTQKMIVLTPLEMFITYIKLSLIAGLFLAMPFMLTQLWLFIAPGLYGHEKRWVVPFVACGSGFFVGGAAFCFYLVLPASFKYLVDMVPLGVEAHYSVSAYFSLVIQLMLAFGLVFELPLIMTILGAAQVVGAAAFARFRKYWLIIAALLGGILTPTPDPMTQMMMAVPLVLFYELGIVGARFAGVARRGSLKK